MGNEINDSRPRQESVEEAITRVKSLSRVPYEYLIVEAIVQDLCDRKGFKQCWADIDDDVHQEIITHWHQLIKDILSRG